MTKFRMLAPDLLAFLARPVFARLSTNGRDGYPHTVPLWFDVEATEGDGHTFWFVTDRDSTKVRNALADPRAALSVGGEPLDTHGVLVRGTLTIEEDPGQERTHRMIDRYEKAPRNEELRGLWKDDDIVVLRLKVERLTDVFG